MGEILGEAFNLSPQELANLDNTISEFIVHGKWVLPDIFVQVFPEVAEALTSTTLPLEPTKDQVVWSGSSSGALTSKEAYLALAPSSPPLAWGSLLWHPAIQPRKSICSWKIFHRRILTDERLQKLGISLCSRCSFCGAGNDNWRHLFLGCEIVLDVWKWCFHMFNIVFPQLFSLHDLLTSEFMSHLSTSSKLLWRFNVCNVLWCLWSERNRLRHDGGMFNWHKFMHFLLLALKESAGLIFASSNSQSGVPMFGFLHLSPLRPCAPKFTRVTWVPPPSPWIKINIDGSFRNRDHAGFGAIARNNDGAFVLAFASRVRVPSALDAEVLACIEAIRVAKLQEWQYVWVETDSTTVLRYFASPKLVPWRLCVQWSNCLALAKGLHLHVSHIFREGNAPADTLANYGASHDGRNMWLSLPSFLVADFGRDFSSRPAYRFS
ncbi:putative ribonuclease H-like domain, reverse transcriptase zinc-binding domain-containing protein [Rosa chinensis]|uniref:Putative ribonuclease H-like domain, reverse transcriptase zinc-binding domain-containing protein n=1 Tax=Rosa chinensis TaxID=74649 RepID=A0A2P6P944_ROSCH|nr:putative ribonuclease H-like domain, reverse transcriptase zinc-binding domain-containing protein [Rosa chinensis]